MRTLLLDSDVLAFQTAASAEVATDWGDDFWTLHADAQNAKDRLANKIEMLQVELEAEAVTVCLSCRTRRYWRHDILPTYKANRAGKRLPMILGTLKQWLTDSYETFERPGLEADDVMGILATSTKIVEGETVIVSCDKDMKTIPGEFYDMGKGKLYKIDEQEADYWHMYQTLVGDATDGYAGCPRVGPKTAEKILDGHGLLWPEHVWPAVVEAFEKKGLTEADALVQARVARICRAEDYDFKRKEVILWTPPS